MPVPRKVEIVVEDERAIGQLIADAISDEPGLPRDPRPGSSGMSDLELYDWLQAAGDEPNAR